MSPVLQSQDPPKQADTATVADSSPDEELIGPAYSWQGLIGFSVGGLLALLAMLSPALLDTDAFEVWARFGGFAIGGAVGGYALAWGAPGKHPSRSGALGFGLGFLIPAGLSAPAALELIANQGKDADAGVFLSTFLSFAIGYCVGGSLGASFIMPRLFWGAGWRFFAAGGLGGLVAALGPTFVRDVEDVTSGQIISLTLTVLAGHMIPFVLGGFWVGRALENELDAVEIEAAKSRRKFKYNS